METRDSWLEYVKTANGRFKKKKWFWINIIDIWIRKFKPNKNVLALRYGFLIRNYICKQSDVQNLGFSYLLNNPLMSVLSQIFHILQNQQATFYTTWWILIFIYKKLKKDQHPCTDCLDQSQHWQIWQIPSLLKINQTKTKLNTWNWCPHVVVSSVTEVYMS